jgi:hypothetical protein
LNEEYPSENVNIEEHMLPTMKDIAIDTILAVKN